MTGHVGYRPVRIRPRTGEQKNGHQTYYIGVPWQVAEAIGGELPFDLSVDEVTSVLTFTPTFEPDQIVPFGSVMAALAACDADSELMHAVARVLRALPKTWEANSHA